MFTGLVQALGRVELSQRRGDLLELVIGSEPIASELDVGASVSVSGVCLTATEISGASFRVDVAMETERRTRLGRLSSGSLVNLELPLRPTTIQRLKNGTHKHSKGFPRPRTIGNRNYYDAEEFMAWFRTLPEEKLGTLSKRVAA